MGKEPADWELARLHASFSHCISGQKEVRTMTCKGLVVFTPMKDDPMKAMVEIKTANNVLVEGGAS
jgi:hypothetical protein